MPENEVRNIRITAAEDERLRAVAPDYLKGGGKIEARVRWAIDEVCKAVYKDWNRLASECPESNTPAAKQ